MELSRLFRIFRARWRLVALVSFVGFASAFGLTALANDGGSPVFEAVIPVEFELEGEETVEDLADEIQSERALAVFSAQDLLATYPDAAIVAETNSARLVFYARGGSEAEALSIAQSFVDAYLEADPSGGGDVGERLAEMERQAEALQAQIDQLQPILSPQEQTLKSQHDLLDLQIKRIQDEIVSLTVANAGADEEEQADNEARIEDLEEELLQLQTEKAALPPPPSGELTPAEQLRLDALVRRKDILTLDYQTLALRTMGVTGGGNVQAATVDDLTPDPPNPLVNGILGLLGGVGVALVALVVTSRARQEVWLPKDLPMPFLGVVPDRRDPGAGGHLWYDQTEGGRRKESIQAVRTAMEGVLDTSAAGLAVVSDGVEGRIYHELVIDLAASFASAGRKVLLVDADYSKSDGGQFHRGEVSLRSLLDPPEAAVGLPKAEIAAGLDDLVEVRDGLAVLPAGPTPASPADTLAGQPLRVLLEEASDRFDLVVVVAGRANSAPAQVLGSRVGATLLAISPGRSTMPGLERLVLDFAYQRVEPIGAVMIQRAGRHLWPSWLKARPNARPRVPGGHGRLLQPPPQRQTGKGLALRRMVDDLSDHERVHDDPRSVVSAEEARELGEEVIGALRLSHPGHAYESVAAYLVTRVEDMLTTAVSRVGMADRLGDVLLRYGFVPLTRVPGHRSMGEWLLEDLRWELGAPAARDLGDEFSRILDSDDDGYPTSLDAWLTDEFFRRHLERTHGEPEVWHLRSDQGTIQVLAYGRSLDRERLDRLQTDAVHRMATLLEQQLDQASKGQRDRIDAMLKDVHLFKVTLELLERAIGDDEAGTHHWRRRDPRRQSVDAPWVGGVSPNIAHFQRFGLLAIPVLTDEEMLALEQAG